MKIRFIYMLLVVAILGGTTSYTYAEEDLEKETHSIEMLKLFYWPAPNTESDFWAILRGTEVEILNEINKHHYDFWSVSGAFSKASSKTTSDTDTQALSLGVGYGTILYFSHHVWDKYYKHKIKGLFDYNKSNASNSSKTYTLSYAYSLGLERNFTRHFGVGVEAEAITASLSHTNSTTSTKWEAKTQLLAAFKIYAKITF